MKKNNFFVAMVFGITALLGTNFELRSSEKSSVVPKEKSKLSFEISINKKAQAYLHDYEKQRRVDAQKCATKITEKTLPSHIIDDYAGECRK